MRFIDLVSMALLNLWRRGFRSFFNTLGIVLGCVILLLTFAAGSGVKNAIHLLFDASEYARDIKVYSFSPDRRKPPKKEIVVHGKMSKERRERIQKRLESEWRRKNSRSRNREVTAEMINKMKNLDHVTHVVPRISISFRIAQNTTPSKRFRLTGITTDSAAENDAIIQGRMVEEESADEILLSEFAAYKLGYRDDQQLKDLVGRELSFQIFAPKNNLGDVFQILTSRFGNSKDSEKKKQENFQVAVNRLLEELDSTNLSELQKKLIRQMIPKPQNLVTGENAPAITKTYTIAGIYKPATGSGVDQMLQSFSNGRTDAKIHYKEANRLYSAIGGRPSFRLVTVKIDSTKNLQHVDEQLEELGADFFSAKSILESIERNIDRSTWAIYGAAAVILLISALGISNTLFSSTFERTPEFGIMKSVGATDMTVVRLMILEGGLLGVLGATIAMLISFLASKLIHSYLADYIERRFWLPEIESSLFQFSLLGTGIVFGTSILVCMAASIIPAWRAAKLDPIVAMQRR